MSARYEPVRLPADGRGNRRWGILDHQAPGPDRVVPASDGDGPESYWSREGAEDWIARQTYLNGVQFVPR